MILPTTRALTVFALFSVVGLVGFLTPFALDLMLLLDTFLFVAVGTDCALAVDPRVIEVTRNAPCVFSVGRTVEFTYSWRNRASRPARLLVRETRPGLLGGVLMSRELCIGSGAVLRESVAATPNRRGKETEGWFAVRSKGPLGLGQRQGRLLLPWMVTVYPNLPVTRLKASIAEAVRRAEGGIRPTRQPGEGSQFESLREWVPGEDTRQIDWKATARRNRVIARQFEEEGRQQVLLVLDAGRLLTADVAGEARMEHVVRAALWLALAAFHHDDNVGVMVVADQILHYVPPQRGKRGLRQVLDVLAVVEPILVEPDYPAAFRHLAVRNRKRALTVFFTDVIDRLASETLLLHVESLRTRHLPLVVTIRNPELDRIAHAKPGTIREAYRKAAAEALLSARHEALGELRSSGAVVLDVSADRASSAVVEKYVELKRRGQL